MRSMARGFGVAALVAAAGALIVPPTASATVLTFDMGVSSGTQVVQTYGDRVGLAIPGPFMYGAAGGPTPNIVVNYTPVLILSNDPNVHYGDLQGVLYRQASAGDNGIFEILFTADEGYEVCLNSFDLAAWVNPNASLQEDLPFKSLRVENGSADVLYALNYTFPNNEPLLYAPGTQPLRHNTYDFGGVPLYARQLRIVINLNQINNKIDKFGIDNIQFSQRLVPSPGSSALLAGSLFAAGLRRRRR